MELAVTSGLRVNSLGAYESRTMNIDDGPDYQGSVRWVVIVRVRRIQPTPSGGMSRMHHEETRAAKASRVKSCGRSRSLESQCVVSFDISDQLSALVCRR